MATLKYKDSQGNYQPVIGYNVTYENEVVQTTGTSTTAVMSLKAVTDELADKQDVLISGTTIKTVNGNSLLGSGNIEIDGGTTGEFVTIALITNQSDNSDLIGSTVKVFNTDNTSEIFLETTWQGNPIELEIQVPINYTVQVGNVNGYTTPSDQSYSTRTGRNRNLTFQYNTEILTVTIAVDKGSGSVSSQRINVTNKTSGAQLGSLSNGQSLKIPHGITYVCTPTNTLDDYDVPASQEYTASSISRSATFTYIENVNYIDLGLPSGTKWAKGNLVKSGNTVVISDDISAYGDFWSWANVGLDTNSGYMPSSGGAMTIEMYRQTTGYNQRASISSIDASHDVAYKYLGARNWHLPTKDNFSELLNNTDKEWTTINGVNGLKCMKKSDHSIYIFLPASGFCNTYSTPQSRGTLALYWTSTFEKLLSNDTYTAHTLYAQSGYYQVLSSGCYCGCTIRPVK